MLQVCTEENDIEQEQIEVRVDTVESAKHIPTLFPTIRVLHEIWSRVRGEHTTSGCALERSCRLALVNILWLIASCW